MTATPWLAVALIFCTAAPALAQHDCNNNGIPDDQDLRTRRVFSLGESIFCLDTYTFDYGPRPAPDTDLDLRVELLGIWLRDDDAYLEIDINNEPVARLWQFDGRNCTGSHFTVYTVPWEQVPDTSNLTISARVVGGRCCGPSPLVAIGIEYFYHSPFDVNQNGIIDTCNDCLADLDGDADADQDDIRVFVDRYISRDPSADLVDDQRLDIDDISAFVDAYLTCFAS